MPCGGCEIILYSRPSIVLLVLRVDCRSPVDAGSRSLARAQPPTTSSVRAMRCMWQCRSARCSGAQFVRSRGHKPAGADGFAVTNLQYVEWFSSWVFAVASSTIPSGSMSERTCLEGYILLSAFVHSWIYPVFYHWVFHGWLSRSFGGTSYVGFMDFSGSAYVHSIGGAVALTGSMFLGARLGRFDANGRPVHRGFKPYSYSLIGLGCLLLWTGWYAFNTLGLKFLAHLSIDQVVIVTGRSSLVTTLGGASGVIGACLYSRFTRKSYDFDSVINGALVGLVAVTAGCVIIQPWAGIVLGLLGGLS
jgi:Amt family ammonium transporter